MFLYLVKNNPVVIILIQNICVSSPSLFLLLDFRIGSLIFKNYSFDVVLVISWSIWIHLRGTDVFAVVSISQVVLYFIHANLAHFLLSLFLGLLIEFLLRLSVFPKFHLLNSSLLLLCSIILVNSCISSNSPSDDCLGFSFACWSKLAHHLQRTILSHFS